MNSKLSKSRFSKLRFAEPCFAKPCFAKLWLKSSPVTVSQRAGGLLALLSLVSGCASHETQRVDAPSAASQSAPASQEIGRAHV